MRSEWYFDIIHVRRYLSVAILPISYIGNNIQREYYYYKSRGRGVTMQRNLPYPSHSLIYNIITIGPGPLTTY